MAINSSNHSKFQVRHAGARLAAWVLILLLSVGLAACGDDDDTTKDPVGPDVGHDVADPDVDDGTGDLDVASLTISPNPASVTLQATLRLTATPAADDGTPLSNRDISWSSADESVATVNAGGSVIGQSIGTTTITATCEGVSATVELTVTGNAVGYIDIAPQQRTLRIGEQITMSVTLRDANRAPIEDERTVEWSSSDAAVASVNSAGVVLGQSTGTATITGTIDGVSDTAAFTVEGSAVHRVALTASTTQVARGATFQFQAQALDLEDTVLDDREFTWTSSDTNVATIDGDGLFTALDSGTTTVTVRSEGKSATASVTVTFVLESIFAGGNHNCAIISGSAFCWGANNSGQLGQGAESASEAPGAVEGGLGFTALSLGDAHTCGLTNEGAIYCWGANNEGQLGNGSTDSSSAPLEVNGARTYTALSAGAEHTCGLASDQKIYCWGKNASGQLGNDSTTRATSPVQANSSQNFAAVAAGTSHTCAIGTDTNGYCWGTNGNGELGTNDTSVRHVPTAVTGGVTLALLGVGDRFSCGVGTAGVGACWGSNANGRLGNGSNSTQEQSPIFVAAPEMTSFSGLAVGQAHACMQANGGRLFCWGKNADDQLGLGGDTGDKNELTQVPGDHVFISVSAGNRHTCAITDDAEILCWGAGDAGQLGPDSSGSASPVLIDGF